MVQVSDLHGFPHVGMEITDTESSSDAPDPSLEVDQLGENSAGEEPYFAS
jgi:hypothetical protein